MLSGNVTPPAVSAERIRLRVRSTISQVTQQTREGHFRISGLEAALDRGLSAALRLGAACAFAEEIRIATELLDGGEREGVDTVLDGNVAGRREACDSVSERSDELIERRGGQRPVDPPVAFGQFRVVVLCAQHDLQGPPATHKAREMLGGAPAGEQT